MSCFNSNVIKTDSPDVNCQQNSKIVQCMISGSSDPRYCCADKHEEDVQYTHSTVHTSNYSRILTK